MTYKFLILGSGLQGSAAASILSRSDYADKIYLVDLDCRMLDKVSNKIASDKLVTICGDATDVELDDDIDIILNFLPPMLNPRIMEMAIKLNAYYVDTASGPDKNLRPIDENVLDAFKYDERFREHGIGGVISCGATPGLTNIYAKLLAEKIKNPKKIFFYAAGYSLNPPKLFEPVHPYIELLLASWNPETAFLYRATKPVVYDCGYRRVEPYSNPEYIDFGRPMGKLLTVLVEHEETVTIPRFIDVDYVEYRNTPDYIAYALIKYGFADLDRKVEVDGVEVNPFNLLRRLWPKPSNHFLHDSYTEEPREMALERILIKVVGDEILEGVLDMEIPPWDIDERKRFYELYGTTYIYVALPAIAGGIYLLENRVEGVYAPEYFDIHKYLEILDRFGYNPKFRIQS